MSHPAPTRSDGLRADPDSGVLLARHSRIVPDPDQPRKYFSEESLQHLRTDISAWRDARRGLAQTGIMTPLQCRWEAGAVDAQGNIKPEARLIIVDGERRWRATEGELEWLPLVLDDMPSEDAHDAALRTNIHKKMLLPIEEANAFQRKKAITGWGTYRLARHYNISEGYVKNRIYLLECSPDVQKMVEEFPDTLSHALAFRAAGDKLPAQDRKELIEQIRHGMPLVALKEEIEARIAAAQWQAESRRAPDRETAQRTSTFERTGGGNVSRGEQVKGASASESLTEAVASLQSASTRIDTAATWFRTVKAEDYERKVLPEIEKLIAKLEMFKVP